MGRQLRVTMRPSRPVEAPRLQGVVGQATQGRRKRGVLCTRATEDAEARSAHGYL
jgi:hypothetical protein